MRTFFLLSLLTLSTATADLAADLKDALTFRATFDGSTNASTALGDKRLFMAPSYKEQATATPGLSGGDVVLEPGGGRHGGALHFLRKNTAPFSIAPTRMFPSIPTVGRVRSLCG
jgi:hypothetical protein